MSIDLLLLLPSPNSPTHQILTWTIEFWYIYQWFLLFLWVEFSSFFIGGFLSVEKWNVFIIFISDFFSSMKFWSFYQWVFDCFISETDVIVFISGFLIVLQVKLFSSFLSVVFWLFYVWNCFHHNFLYQWNLGYFNTLWKNQKILHTSKCSTKKLIQ